jgi:hypothetical protein
MGEQRRPARPLQPSARAPQPAPAADTSRPLVRVGRWTGGLAKALWAASRLTISDFAMKVGVGASTVDDWDANPNIIPHAVNQDALDEVLHRATDAQKVQFAILTVGNPLVWVSDSLGLVPNVKERGTRRRDVLGLGMAAATEVVPMDALERITAAAERGTPVDRKLIADHEDIADALAILYLTARPDALVAPVSRHADLLLGLLDRPLSPEHQRQLQVITVDSHLHVGALAFSAGDRITARHYLATARSVAEDSGDDTLIARALAKASVLPSSIPRGGQGGDTDRAVKLLRQATDHARRADRITRTLAHSWLAEELAVARDAAGSARAWPSLNAPHCAAATTTAEDTSRASTPSQAPSRWPSIPRLVSCYSTTLTRKQSARSPGRWTCQGNGSA